jgi:hypothetical protein
MKIFVEYWLWSSLERAGNLGVEMEAEDWSELQNYWIDMKEMEGVPLTKVRCRRKQSLN